MSHTSSEAPATGHRVSATPGRVGDHRIAVLAPTAAVATGSLGSLTRREIEVLALIAAGDTNKEIARKLSIATKTAMHHTTSIYRKLGARGRAEATAIGLREGLVEPDRKLLARQV